RGPAAASSRSGYALLRAAFADRLGELREVLGEALAGVDHVVERVGDLAVDAGQAFREADCEIAALHGFERGEQRARVELFGVLGRQATRGSGHRIQEVRAAGGRDGMRWKKSGRD